MDGLNLRSGMVYCKYLISVVPIGPEYGSAPPAGLRRDRRGGQFHPGRGAPEDPAAAPQPAAQGARIRAGLALFRRLPRGVELTPAGGAFLAEARAMIAGLDKA